MKWLFYSVDFVDAQKKKKKKVGIGFSIIFIRYDSFFVFFFPASL